MKDNDFFQALRSVDRNTVALLLSVIPGAGHLYKRNYAAGFGILIGGNLLMVFIAILLALATFLTSLVVVPIVYWIAVAALAYTAPDRQGEHHWLHPWSTPQDQARPEE